MNSSDNNYKDNTEPENNTSVRNVLSPGSMLKQKRESGNLELNSIARELNLDPWMLTALEADDFSKFGAQVFAKGHLKHYAQHLGLKPDDVLFAYYQVAERKETTPVISKHLSSATTKKSHSNISRWFIRFLGLIAIAALLYGAYQGVMWWLQDAKGNSTVTELSLDNTTSSPEPASTDSITLDVPVINETRLNPQSTQAIPETVIQTETGSSNNNPSEAASPTTVENASQSADSSQIDIPVASAPVASQRQQLRFTFQESSWIEVFSESGDRLIYGMANEGTVRNIRINGPTEIFLGNAEGTVITLNGQIYSIPNNAKAGRTARFVLDPGL